MLRKELHNQIVNLIGNKVSSIQDPFGIQFYMKFKLLLMDLDVSSRPKESSWPHVLLDVFILDSIDWPTHLRLEKVIQF